MKTTVNRYQFHHAFETTRPDNFTYNGLKALFNYLEDLEADTGEEIELDVIALCCDYTEYENVDDYVNAYNTKYDKPIVTDYEDFTEYESELEQWQNDVKEEIAENTTFIDVDGESFIIQNY